MTDAIHDALTYIDPTDRMTWVHVGMALHDELGDDAGFDVWDQWSQQADNYRAANMPTQWRSFGRRSGITVGTLYHYAQENGWQGSGERRERPVIDREATRRRHDEERRKHERAAEKAQGMLADAVLSTHPYLAAKGFPLEQGFVLNGSLLVPMRDRRTNAIQSAQIIATDGTKRFLPGGKARDAVYPIGRGHDVYLCEGYATALSVREALRSLYAVGRIVVCFSASNLAHVAQSIGDYVLADNDASKTGERYARQTGLPWWMPPEVGMDANDWHQEVGVRRLAHDINGLRRRGGGSDAHRASASQ